MKKYFADEQSMLFSVLCLSGDLLQHFFLPLEISHRGDEGVESEEAGHCVQAFPSIEGGGNEVDNYPQPPVLDVLLGQQIHGYHAEGSGE